MYNISSDEFDSKESKRGFNGGKAGECPCTISIYRKSPEDNENAPDYKVIYTEVGQESFINHAFWRESQDPEREKKAIRNLKHLVKTTLGDNFLAQIPPKNTYGEILDEVMNIMDKNIQPSSVFYVFCNFGTSMGPKKYTQPRTWPPFIRREDQDPIEAGDIDIMERPAPDATSAPQAEAPTINTDW